MSTLEELLLAERRRQAEPARRPLSDKRLGMLIGQALILVALLVIGALSGLAHSRRGFEAIGLGWVAVDLLIWHARPLGRAATVGRGLLTLAVGGALAVAVLSAPGVHSPIPDRSVAAARPVSPQVAQALDRARPCGDLQLNVSYARCVWDHAQQSQSPTATKGGG